MNSHKSLRKQNQKNNLFEKGLLMKIAVLPDAAMMIVHLITKNGHEYLSVVILSFISGRVNVYKYHVTL